MKLRNATPADFDKIYPIYMDKTVNPYMSFPVMSKEKFLPVFENFVNELKIYEEADNLLALVGITRLPHRSSHVAYIHKLAVNPEFQNKGIGRKLFSTVITDLKNAGVKRLELKVESDNHNAIAFYKKIGFQIEGTLKGYFNREGEMVDEHFMGMMIS
jgi:putative acetyltransferase